MLSAEVKHQTSHGISASSAIVAKLVERLVFTDGLILLKRRNQIKKRSLGYGKFVNRRLDAMKTG